MNGTEIISFLTNNFPTIMSAVGAITGSLFTAIFLRHNTSAKEFEKIKNIQGGKYYNVVAKAGKGRSTVPGSPKRAADGGIAAADGTGSDPGAAARRSIAS